MTVDPTRAAAKVEHAGKTCYFCSPGCAKRFQQAPEKYLRPGNTQTPSPGLVNLHNASKPSGAAAAPAAKEAKQVEHEAFVTSAVGHAERKPTSKKPPAGDKQVRYTCPMHPDIIQIGPGSCPICGMALEPMDVFAQVEADPEYDSMRLCFGAVGRSFNASGPRLSIALPTCSR